MRMATGLFWCRCERSKTGSFKDEEFWLPAVLLDPNGDHDVFTLLEKAVKEHLGKDWEVVTYQPIEDRIDPNDEVCN